MNSNLNLKYLLYKYLGYLFLEYIKFFAKIRLYIEKPFIIGVTGSAGKTSTKEATKLVLEQKYRVKVLEKGNSESGVSLEVLDIKIGDYSLLFWLRVALLAPFKSLQYSKYDILLVEMGVDSPFYPKNMSFLLSILTPNISVLTNVGLVHSANYDLLNSTKSTEEALQLIYNEKSKIFHKAEYRVTSGDDPTIIRNNPKKVLFVEKKSSKDGLQIISTERNIEYGTNINYKYRGEYINIKIPNIYLTESYIYTIGFAVLVGLLKGVPINEIESQLKQFKAKPGRSTVIKGVNGSYILDGSYNASPESMIDFIQSSVNISTTGRKILVMGDMRELGSVSEITHRKIAYYIHNKFDEIYLVGKEVEYTRDELIHKYNIKTDRIILSNSSKKVGEMLNFKLKKGDIVLVKGSQNTIFLEECIKQILYNTKDVKLLCRQDPYWTKIKRELKLI